MYRPANGIERCPMCKKIMPLQKTWPDWHMTGHLLFLRDFKTFYRYNPQLAMTYFVADMFILFIFVCCISTIVRNT